jgi:hypothetical protein
VRVRGAAGLKVGEFAEVQITAASTYDLEGRYCGAQPAGLRAQSGSAKLR